ncbi:MAG: hypothetical protein KIT34_09920 [Cyanobacteria bacterium TGS_CYA1]|nr:hypothetical protein [Cyanobacteria bacterium TGS_CYA1]
MWSLPWQTRKRAKEVGNDGKVRDCEGIGLVMAEYTLLINAAAPEESEPRNRFGGRPLVPKNSKVGWPNCKSCNLPMQFIGQLMVAAHSNETQNLCLMFMCDRDPGVCETWMPDGGANQVILVPVDEDMVLLEPPRADGCLRNITYGATLADASGEDIYTAMLNYVEKSNSTFDNILGNMFGTPEWIQSDETPHCNKCKKLMRAVAVLNEGPDPMESVNFGTGEAYLFDCACGDGKFLWQC